MMNFKNAAHYDLKTVKIILPDGEVCAANEAALKVIEKMKAFYRDFTEPVREVLRFEEEKMIDPEKRYAWKVRKAYGGGFVKKGMALARERQKRQIGNAE